MGKQFDGNGQQNDAEEFLQHIDGSGAENAVNFFGNFEYDVNPKHIEQNGENDIDIRVLGADGKQCGQTAGTGYQRKNDGNKSCFLRRIGRIFENFDIKNHLQSHDKNDERAGNGERRNINMEQVQKGFSDVEETDKHSQRKQSGFFGIYFLPFFFRLRKIGIEPVTSMTANKTTKALTNCCMLNSPSIIFLLKYLMAWK